MKRGREKGRSRGVGNWRTHSLRPDDSINEGKDTVNYANCRYLPQRITQSGSRGTKEGGKKWKERAERGREGRREKQKKRGLVVREKGNERE